MYSSTLKFRARCLHCRDLGGWRGLFASDNLSVDTFAGEIDDGVEVLPWAVGCDLNAALAVCDDASVSEDLDFGCDAGIEIGREGYHGHLGTSGVCVECPIGIATDADRDGCGFLDERPGEDGIDRIFVVSDAACRSTTSAHGGLGVTSGLMSMPLTLRGLGATYILYQ